MSAAHRRWVLALLGTAFFMTVLDGTSLLTALPSIENDLHLGGPAIQWTVTAYALAFSGPLLLFGRAADLLGRRRMFLTGMALRVCASLLCGLAPSAGILVAGRALQGVSAAIIAPAALSMVTNTFAEGAERNRALGVWGGLGGIGATAGLLLGGIVTETLGWQWVFWINLPVGLAVLAVAPSVLRESRGPVRERPFDVAGAVTMTLAMTLLVYAVTEPPSPVRTLVPLVAGLALAALFAAIERRSAAPLVPFRVLRSRVLIGGNLVVLTAGMTVDGMLVTLTAYAQQVLGWPAMRFGLVAAAMTVSAVAGGLASARPATRFGVRRVAVAGTVLLAGGCALLTRISPGGSTVLVLTALPVFGAGMGATAVCGQIAALAGVGERYSGLAAGLSDTSFAVGTALGVAVCGTLALVAGAGTAFAAAGLFACLGLAAALTLLPRHRATERPRELSRRTARDEPAF